MSFAEQESIALQNFLNTHFELRKTLDYSIKKNLITNSKRSIDTNNDEIKRLAESVEKCELAYIELHKFA